MKFIYSILFAVVLVLFSCGDETTDDQASDQPDSTVATASDTLSEWISWAEESGDGLWEDGSHRFTLVEERIYGGQEFPPFYNVEGMSFRGDTMYVSDPTNQSLVAVSLETGEKLWLFGEAGEGPGHFNGIGEVAASDSVIAVCDTGNGKVALINTGGNLIDEILIGCPFDVIWKGDSLLVLSLAADKPVSGFLADGTPVGSWGNLPVEMGILSHINRHLHGALDADSNVLIISRFVNGIWRVNMERDSTELLAEMVFPQGEIVNDLTAGAWMVLCRDIFIGPDGAINVILPVFTESGGTLADGGDMASVTLVHRYSDSSEYLDSWALGGTVGIALMHDGRLYTADRYEDGVVRCWEIVR